MSYFTRKFVHLHRCGEISGLKPAKISGLLADGKRENLVTVKTPEENFYDFVYLTASRNADEFVL